MSTEEAKQVDLVIQKAEEDCKKQTHLTPQTLTGFDISKLSVNDPQIISRQATLNIGTIGHVAHGKSTLVRAISTVNVSQSLSSLLDCQTSQRKDQKHHYQAGIRKC